MAHLTLDQREQIYALRQSGRTQMEIAKTIGKGQATVSKELQRNRAGPRLGYLPDRATEMASKRRRRAKDDTDRWWDHEPLLVYVRSKLTCRSHVSPEQIAGRLKKDFPDDAYMRASHESIYAYVWEDKRQGGTLYTCLRHRGKKHMNRGGKAQRGHIPNRRDIGERASEVEGKQVAGHYESDLVVGPQGTAGAIVTIVERVSKKLFAVKISRRTARAMTGATIRALGHLPHQLRKSMTHDNGKEIVGHERITQALGMPVFCATPYHSWERGLNEHTNGLVRQYCPKGMVLKNLTQLQLDNIADAINTRPRKILAYRTPNEVFEEQLLKYSFQA